MKVKQTSSGWRVSGRLLSGEKWNEYEADILKSRFIRGVVRGETTYFRGFAFDVPHSIPLRRYLSQGVGRESFLSVLALLMRVLQELEENRLATEKLLWDLDCIFVIPVSKEIKVCYLPVSSTQRRCDIVGFVNSMIRESSFTAAEDTGYINELLDLIRRSGAFTVDRIVDYVQQWAPEGYPWLKKSKSSDTGINTEDWSDPDEPGTMLLEEEENLTMPMESEPEILAWVRRVKTGERFSVTGDRFLMGREEDEVDCFLGGNLWIGRKHAYIYRSGDDFYLCDNQSLNGTWLDRVRLKPGERTFLIGAPGPAADQAAVLFRMADEDFEFVVERG